MMQERKPENEARTSDAESAAEEATSTDKRKQTRHNAHETSGTSSNPSRLHDTDEDEQRFDAG